MSGYGPEFSSGETIIVSVLNDICKHFGIKSEQIVALLNG